MIVFHKFELFFFIDLDAPILHPINITKEGEAVIFQCSAKGTGALSYEWEKDGKKLNEKRPIFIINNANRKDQGYYRCIVTNDAGIKATPAVLLDVLCKYGFILCFVEVC